MGKYHEWRKKYHNWLQDNPSELEKILDHFPESEFKRNQISKLCLNPNSKYFIEKSNLAETDVSEEEEEEELQQEESKLHEKNGRTRRITIIEEEKNEN